MHLQYSEARMEKSCLKENWKKAAEDKTLRRSGTSQHIYSSVEVNK